MPDLSRNERIRRPNAVNAPDLRDPEPREPREGPALRLDDVMCRVTSTEMAGVTTQAGAF